MLGCLVTHIVYTHFDVHIAMTWGRASWMWWIDKRWIVTPGLKGRGWDAKSCQSALKKVECVREHMENLVAVTEQWNPELSSLSSNCLLIDLLKHSNIYLIIAACNEIIKLSNSGSCNVKEEVNMSEHVFLAPCDIQLFFVSRLRDRKMALIQMSSVEEGIQALMDLHNYDMGGNHHLKVSFSKSTI